MIVADARAASRILLTAFSRFPRRSSLAAICTNPTVHLRLSLGMLKPMISEGQNGVNEGCSERWVPLPEDEPKKGSMP